MEPTLAFALTATAISALLLFCWIMEMRTVQNLRDLHRKAWDERYAQELNSCQKMNRDFEELLTKARHEAWKEGVKMGAEARRQMRYNQHGQHSHNNKPGRF